jgi:hypothetical protein
VLNAVARISSEFGIPWVRRPFDFPLQAAAAPWPRRAISQTLGFARAHFHRVLARHGCRTTDHFAGFQMTGNYNAAELAHLIRCLPDGVTEFMCHPALTSAQVWQAIEESNVQLARYVEIR